MQPIEPPFPLALMCLKNTLLYSREICKINKRSRVVNVKKNKIQINITLLNRKRQAKGHQLAVHKIAEVNFGITSITSSDFTTRARSLFFFFTLYSEAVCAPSTIAMTHCSEKSQHWDDAIIVPKASTQFSLLLQHFVCKHSLQMRLWQIVEFVTCGPDLGKMDQLQDSSLVDD